MFKISIISGIFLLAANLTLAATGNSRLTGKCVTTSSNRDDISINFDLDTISNPNFTIPAFSALDLEARISFTESSADAGRRHIIADMEIFKMSPWGTLRKVAKESIVNPRQGDKIQVTAGYGPNITCDAIVTQAPTVKMDSLKESTLNIEEQRIRVGVATPTFTYCGLRLHFPSSEAPMKQLLDQIEITGRKYLDLIVVPYSSRDEVLILIDQKSWHEYVFIETKNRESLNSVITEALYPNSFENLGTIELLKCPNMDKKMTLPSQPRQ